MPVFERQTRVGAPFEDVWAFHSNISGLETLTPPWMNLVVENVRGPDGTPDPEILEAGSVAHLSMRPFGVGPRIRWESHILEREEHDGAAMFRDEMRHGPFRRWVHSHRFFADGAETVVSDRVEYQLPYPPVGTALGPFARLGLEPMFRERHRKTREHFG
jgi:ligand-binding SRPBCC domain-containing protein